MRAATAITISAVLTAGARPVPHSHRLDHTSPVVTWAASTDRLGAVTAQERTYRLSSVPASAAAGCGSGSPTPSTTSGSALRSAAGVITYCPP
ncbi:hypothetical protein ACFYXH_28795 [Streptomyces sp. NPDC002730]|uniref:hypothetical protein n=1 Tax=Streptomyces sp. NPDC002730 TaxID=3364662 RepID=UPI0036D11010